MDKEKFAAAYELYCQRPTHENGVILLTFVGDWISTRELAAFGPCLAICEVLNERQHFAGNPLRRFAQRRLLPPLLRHYLKADRPGWNDYYMARWQLTKEQNNADEIHRRVAHLSEIGESWAMVRWSAGWMAGSQREQSAEFDAALRLAEQRCVLCRAKPWADA